MQYQSIPTSYKMKNDELTERNTGSGVGMLVVATVEGPVLGWFVVMKDQAADEIFKVVPVEE